MRSPMVRRSAPVAGMPVTAEYWAAYSSGPSAKAENLQMSKESEIEQSLFYYRLPETELFEITEG